MLDMLVGFLRSVLGGLVSILPHSPFEQFYGALQVPHQILGWVNWFVPVGTLLGIMAVWLVAVAGYYVYKALLHWAGLGD